MSLIEARNLGKTYADDDVEIPALRSATLSIERGEFVAIMGPSGSGKSTLLHLLGFLDRHTSGTYRFDNKTIDDYTEAELAHVRNQKMGFVFQAFNLLPRLTVLENVKLPLFYSDVPHHDWNSRAEEAVTQVGLSHRLNQEAHRLSGGEKQRVAIARALVMRPDVIFADEPTGNLDSVSGGMVMEVIQRLNEGAGHTIILVTHETYTAEHACRIIRLHDGEITKDELIGAQHRATDGLKK